MSGPARIYAELLQETKPHIPFLRSECRAPLDRSPGPGRGASMKSSALTPSSVLVLFGLGLAVKLAEVVERAASAGLEELRKHPVGEHRPIVGLI